MPDRIADTLVLVFTYGMSLRGWQSSGLLAREWALYDALLPRYERLVLATYGGPDDAAALDAVIRPEHRPKVAVVCRAPGISVEAHAADLPARVAASVGDARTVVVKTNQMVGGEVAVGITQTLRAGGRRVALVARGGYLWTRFAAHDHGPDSPAATDAAAREGALCAAADLVVGTTPDMVEDLAWRYLLPPERVTVIPNYVLIDRPVRPASERTPGLLLYAGQLSPRKRVDLLIRAVAMLDAATRSAVTLEIIGEGPERKALGALAASLAAPVRFLPRLPHHDVIERMSACAVYAQASELEGHPKTVLEAMAAGTPVVVADAPGLGDVVTHGGTGLRLPPDPAAFAHALQELLRDEDWREQLGGAASRAIRTSFGLPTVIALECAAHRRAADHGWPRAQSVPAARVA